MKAEEAIKNLKEHCYFANLIPQAKEAINMAIEVLEQQSTVWHKVEDKLPAFNKKVLVKTDDDKYAIAFIKDNSKENWPDEWRNMYSPYDDDAWEKDAYGKIIEWKELEGSMNANEYQRQAMRTNDGKATNRLLNKTTMADEDVGGVINASLGLSGEVGELNDMIKKWIFHGKPLEEGELCKELGDILWYIAMFCESMSWDIEEVMQQNIEKLKKRYPEGFDIKRANNREGE